MTVKGFDKVLRKAQALQQAMATRVPVKMQAAAVRHFRDNFKAQGWVDRGTKPWPKRKAAPASRDRRPSRRILINRALLLNSIGPDGRATWNRIGVKAGGPHVPYAKIHNEGGWIRRQVTRRAHSRRAHIRRTTRYGAQEVSEAKVRRHQARMNLYMPKRQFMGDSYVLRQKMRETITKTIVESLVK